MIIGDETSYLLKYKYETNSMEGRKIYLKMTCRSVFSYFSDNKSRPLHLDKLSFQNYPCYLVMKCEEEGGKCGTKYYIRSYGTRHLTYQMVLY